MRILIGELVVLVTQELNKQGRFMKFVFILSGFLMLSLYSFSQDKLLLEKVKETKQMEYDFAFAEGLRLKMLGNPLEAGKQFSKCLKLQAEQSAPYYELGSLTLVMNDIPLAEEYSRVALNLDPENEWYRFLLIQIVLKDNRYIEAADLYEALQEQFPEKSEYLIAEIDLRIKAGEYKIAKKKLKELEKIVGYGAHIAMRKRDIFLFEGKEDKAIRELRELVEFKPDEIEYRGILAELLVEHGKDEEAMKEYEKIKTANSGNPIVYFSLGQYYMDKGERHKAIEEFKTGFRSKQVSAEIKSAVFMELLKSDTEKKGLSKDLESLLGVLYEADHGHPGVDGMYGDYLYDKQDIEEAEIVYLRVVESNPGNFIAWQNLLFIQNSQLDFTMMYELASKAVKAFPNQSLFYLFKGIGASGLEKYSAAVEALKKGARLNPNNPDLTKQFYITLGDAYYRLENYKEAFLNFDLLLLLDSDNVVVLNNYSYYLSVLNRDLDKAWKMITRCIEMEPENSTYLDTEAWVLFRLQKYDVALKAVKKAVDNEKDTVSGEVWEHYGDILYMSVNPERSMEMWKKAKEAGGASEKIDEKIRTGRINE